MKATNSWITYRTRFLVEAKQLTASLTFTDLLGRPHSGRKGDYLVESSDNVLRIVPRQIFEDIYVPLLASPDETPAQSRSSRSYATPPSNGNPLSPSISPHIARKSPQPLCGDGRIRPSSERYRDRRTSNPGMRSL
jgi:hypothetical protein